jgi:hypothetical protein
MEICLDVFFLNNYRTILYSSSAIRERESIIPFCWNVEKNLRRKRNGTQLGLPQALCWALGVYSLIKLKIKPKFIREMSAEKSNSVNLPSLHVYHLFC